MSRPLKITIAIPTYNAESFIRETLDSIFSQEDPPEFEVVVSDNCSVDRTREVILSYPFAHKIRLHLNTRNLGITANFNKCIEYANGEYICILSSDDVLERRFMKRMCSILDDFTDVGMAICMARFIDESSKLIGRQTVPFDKEGILTDALEYLLLYNRIYTPSVVVRRDVYGSVGLFDVNLSQAFDYDMWLRITSREKVYFVKEFLCRYRIHSDSQTHLYSIARRVEENLTVIIKNMEIIGMKNKKKVLFLKHHIVMLLIWLLKFNCTQSEVEESLQIVERSFPEIRETLGYDVVKKVGRTNFLLSLSLLRLIQFGKLLAAVGIRRSLFEIISFLGI